MTDKPNLTRVWAKTAPGGNVVDPDTVTAGKFAAGWQAEVPPFEYFNFIQKQVTEGLAHINEQGIAVWDEVTPYPVGGMAKGSDGNVYKALVSQNDNDPVSDNGTNWIDWEVSNRVIRVTSIAAIEAYAVPAGYVFSLNANGRSGTFDVVAGDFSTELAADTLNGLYIGLSDNPLATSKVARRRNFKIGCSIEWFGAVGDNSTNNTAAIQAALNICDFLFIPEGVFRYTGNINKTGSSLTIIGAGTSISELSPVGSVSFTFNGGGPLEYGTSTLTVKDMSWRQVGTNSGSVLNVLFSGGEGSTATSATLNNIEVTGATGTDIFNSAITCTDARNLNFNKIRIMGDRTNGSAQQSNHGIELLGASSPVEAFLSEIRIYFVKKALIILDSFEGVYLNQCAFVAVDRGVEWITSGGEPLLSLVNSHINARLSCVITVGVVQYGVTSNLFYGQSIDGNFIGIAAKNLAGNANGKITGNTFITIGAAALPNISGIILEAESGLSNVIISGNTFDSFRSGVVFSSGCVGALVTDLNSFVSCDEDVAGDLVNNIYASRISDGGTVSLRTNSGDVRKNGTFVTTLDASGNGTFSYPQAFTNSFLTGIVTNGDPGSFGDLNFSINQTASGAASVVFSVRPNPGAVSVRANYVTFGL